MNRIVNEIIRDYKFKFIEKFLIKTIENKNIYGKYFLSWLLLKNENKNITIYISEQLGNIYLHYENKKIPLIFNNRISYNYDFLSNNIEFIELILTSLKANEYTSKIFLNLPFYGKFKFIFESKLNYIGDSTIILKPQFSNANNHSFYEIILFILEHYSHEDSFTVDEINFFNEEYYNLTESRVDFNKDLEQYISLLKNKMSLKSIIDY